MFLLYLFMHFILKGYYFIFKNGILLKVWRSGERFKKCIIDEWFEQHIDEKFSEIIQKVKKN